MILTSSTTMEELPQEIISEAFPEPTEGRLVEILESSKTTGAITSGDIFFASNIWFASWRMCGLSTNHEQTSNESLQLFKSSGMLFGGGSGVGSGSGGGGGSGDGGASSTLSLSKIYNFN